MTWRNILSVSVLVLPLAVLSVWVACLLYHRAHAPVYTVMIAAYDPRDLVHGRYMQFRYLWDDPASQKPEAENLPETGRFYLPEHDAQELELMMSGGAHFSADVGVWKENVQIRALKIDGRSWQEALDAWRQNRNNGAHE